jgi:hypothetical protein
MKPRAMIGYLVRFKASNIWRIWVPKARKVISARDCIFDETSFYQSDILYDIVDDQSEEVLEPLTEAELDLVIAETSIDEPIEEELTTQTSDETEENSDIEAEEDTREDTREDYILGDLPPSPQESEREESENQEESEDGQTLKRAKNAPYTNGFRGGSPSLRP